MQPTEDEPFELPENMQMEEEEEGDANEEKADMAEDMEVRAVCFGLVYSFKQDVCTHNGSTFVTDCDEGRGEGRRRRG